MQAFNIVDVTDIVRIEAGHFGIRFHLIELRNAIGTAEHEEPQRPPFPRRRVLDQPRFRGCRFLQRLQILGDAFGRSDHLAVIVLTNADQVDRSAIVNGIADIYLQVAVTAPR